MYSKVVLGNKSSLPHQSAIEFTVSSFRELLLTLHSIYYVAPVTIVRECNRNVVLLSGQPVGHIDTFPADYKG